MKRVQDNSYNHLNKHSSYSVISSSSHNNQMQSQNGHAYQNSNAKSNNRTLERINANQAMRSNIMSHSALADKKVALNTQHSRLADKRHSGLSNISSQNAVTIQSQLGRSSDIGQASNRAKSTNNAGFNYKFNQCNNLNKSTRSSQQATKNQFQIQSHYGLNTSHGKSNNKNHSSFILQQQSAIKLNSANHSSRLRQPTHQQDHSALKQFAIEQLSLITQSQYQDEEADRRNIIQSDRPLQQKQRVFTKGATLVNSQRNQMYERGLHRTNATAQKTEELYDQDDLRFQQKLRQPTSSYLKNVEERKNRQQPRGGFKDDPYRQQVVLKGALGSENPFEPISHQALSEGRSQKNFAHFRQFNKGKKYSGNNGMDTLTDKSEKSNSIRPQPHDFIRLDQMKNKGACGDASIMGSTAAQSSDKGINAFSQKLIEDKYKQIARMSAATQIERPYKKNMQKQLLCRQIRDRLRQEFYSMYRNAEMAYAALDYTGLGYITEDAFMSCQIISQRLPFTVDQIRMFFEDYNLFNKESPGLNFDTFKKNFFPHLYLVQDPADDEADRDAEKDRNEIKQHGDKYNMIVEKRVQKLEAKLKVKFSNCFESVRKAFLALDTDFDGFITVEDILKYFGTDTDLNYNELQKLMNDKDSKKMGRINYQDFSKWLGNTIHMPQGFYFRHDSILNPNYNQQLEKQEQTLKNADRKEVTKILLGTDIEKKILEKIKFQWKTIRKAFQDMNVSKTGKISKDEFKYYLQFWGITITEDQFNQVFNKFDLDKDGQLSYKEFQQSIGAEMFPQEGLYFRQDKAQQCHVNTCKQSECWQPTKNKVNFCDVHQKMHQGLAIQNFSKLFKQFGNRWPQFIDELKRASDADDQSQISFNTFINLTKEYGGTLNKHEFNEILMAFPGKEGGDRGVRIDIGRIYDQKYFQILQKVYDRMDFAITGGEDDPVDQIGYIGKTVHQRDKLGPLKDISHGEFIYVIFKNNKLKEIMFDISQIDNHTGVVTKNEMDDILKLHYPEKFKDKNLMPIISLFSSIQNKILIDHQKMRDWILKGLAKIELKIEKKRLMKQKDQRIKGGQVTAMDMISHQNNTILKQINNLERKLNLNQEKLERRTESWHKSQVQQKNLMKYNNNQIQTSNDNLLQSHIKQRPVSSFKAYDSRKSGAQNDLTYLQVDDQFTETEPDTQLDAKKIHKNSKIQNQNEAMQFGLNYNGSSQAVRRPNSSMGGGSTTALNKNRLNLLETKISSYIDKDTSEYVNIKDFIKNDKENLDRRKNSASSRNQHISSTMQQNPIKFTNKHNYNNSAQDWNTGHSQKFKYTSTSSNRGADKLHQTSKQVAHATSSTYQNQARRPYSSMHRMSQSNRSGENSQIEFPQGTLDRHQGRVMQIDRSLAALRRKNSVGNVVGGTDSYREDAVGASRRNLARTQSESQLVENAYSKSKLVPTSDQMIKKLVNFGLEKEIEKKLNQKQRSIKSKLEYLQGLDDMGFNQYDQLQKIASKTPQIRTDPIYENYSDEDQNNSNYYTPIDTNQQNGQSNAQDNSDFKNLSSFAKDQNLRRSESLVRNSYREYSNDSHNLHKMYLNKKRNTSIEVQLPLSSQAPLERRFQQNYKIRKILSSQNLSHLSPSGKRLSFSVSQQDNQSLNSYATKVFIPAIDRQMICNKLAYEWKNIFRAILRHNSEKMQKKMLGSPDFVLLKDFDAICQRFGVTLIKEQINKIQKLFAANSINQNQVGDSVQGSIKGVINFLSLSQVLGLHKDSYNYMGQHSLSNERSRSIFRLQRTQQSIEPVEEESIQGGQNYSDYDYKKDVNLASRKNRGTVKSAQRGSTLMAEDWDMTTGKFIDKKKMDLDHNELKIRKPSFTSLEDHSNKIHKLKKLKKHLGSQGSLMNKQQHQRDFQRRNYLHEKEKLALLTAVTEEELAKYDKESRRKEQNKFSKRGQREIVSTISSTSPHIFDAKKQSLGLRSDSKKIRIGAAGFGY